MQTCFLFDLLKCVLGISGPNDAEVHRHVAKRKDIDAKHAKLDKNGNPNKMTNPVAVQESNTCSVAVQEDK